MDDKLQTLEERCFVFVTQPEQNGNAVSKNDGAVSLPGLNDGRC
jgi:hypothetical protein